MPSLFLGKPSNLADPNRVTEFYLTVNGATPRPFAPDAPKPDVVVRQGDVEDWIIENRSTELHVFHIQCSSSRDAGVQAGVG